MVDFSTRSVLFWEVEGLIRYFCETEDFMKWINKIWHVHIMKYYTHIKKE